MEYQTTETSPHGRAEELQWAQILATGDSAKGMIIVLEQKMCTAFHEFEPAWRASALDARHLPFFRERLAKRIKRVLVAMENNNFNTLPGFAELAELARAVDAAKTMDDLANLAEREHTISHIIADALSIT
ncbi:MAG: hypothetical protein HY868_21525 [Chloroflexi bacterium]|nr:hypothetical protein [Chloroflexota bacterium]